MEEITIGAVVELQSGSAHNLMTVVDKYHDGIERLKVTYEDKDNWNKLKTEVFPAAALKVYKAPAPRKLEVDEDI